MIDTSTPDTVTYDDVRRCLDGSGPMMRFQPIVHSDSGRVIGAEAFSRFPSSAPVLDWFRCAEATGLGSELELRAVTNVLESHSRWPRSWEMVCVNLAPERLHDSSMRTALTSAPDVRLVVELTDQTALPTDRVLGDHLERLRDSGVLVAVSGLRPGEVAYERLLRIQPEVVKLDASVLEGVLDHTSLQKSVETLVSACRRNGIFVVAVGIETEEQLDFVRSMGIDAAQGHLFGAAADLDDPSLAVSHSAVDFDLVL